MRLKLYKGKLMVTGRESPKSLYSSTLVTFEDDKAFAEGPRVAARVKYRVSIINVSKSLLRRAMSGTRQAPDVYWS